MDQDNVMEEDWNIMILVDACRYDIFSKAISNSTLKGELHRVKSLCRNTPEWYERYFSHIQPDKILVTSSPMPYKFGKEYRNFFRDYPSWKYEDWLLPKSAFRDFKKAFISYPNKRFIVHIIPPHLPYFGINGIKFQHNVLKIDKSDGDPSIYNAVNKYGQENGWNDIIKYYEENVNYAIMAIEQSIDIFKGKVCITSDHGELIGENNFYGHNVDDTLKIDVPYFVLGGNDDS